VVKRCQRNCTKRRKKTYQIKKRCDACVGAVELLQCGVAKKTRKEETEDTPLWANSCH
jgi:hypothetical protein